MNASSAAAAHWSGQTTPDLNETDLHYFCQIIDQRAGIYLKPAKHDLVRTRLRSRVVAHGLNDFAEYRQFLEKLPANDPEWQAFTNLLTTNKTDFFREPNHFHYLTQKILPAWLKTKQKTFKVWSAASSTGEEPYTLSMVLSRHLPKDRDFKILATDIDTEVLKTAQNGVYSMTKKTEIPPDYQNCIQLGKGDARSWFRIAPGVKEKIIYKQHNLIEKTAPSEGTFDLVLCRNVLIYFEQENIDFVQRKLFGATKDGGHLFIGHSESFQGIAHQWKSVGPSVFKKGST